MQRNVGQLPETMDAPHRVPNKPKFLEHSEIHLHVILFSLFFFLFVPFSFSFSFSIFFSFLKRNEGVPIGGLHVRRFFWPEGG
jgi:hypothetical protein